ncbi:Aste57867_11123 [Aphanomyces stellatus]|uniref:Aste57867_11123 protein n=1 Tax=Aphanomyces stellatus TaxID=120398 RepID=A0A485KTZ9_9STRA|nr:hypothetical protein As57867_011081 [Aphanomyces stellatus]VFT87990.1 Aste57867_11123 [Aphanomyces stellatus]
MAPMLPLPSNYFRCPLLEAHESEFLIQEARTNSIDVIARTKLQDGPMPWVLDSQDGEQLIYRGQDWDAPHGVQTYLGVLELKATLEEVAQLYACHTEEEIAEQRRTISKDVVDAHQLYVLAAPTPSNPRHFIGVKWAILASPAPALMKARDWVFLESHHDFDWEGRRGWARATKSIKLPFLPSLEDSLNVVRGFQLRSGFVFVETERPGFLQAMQLHQFDLRGKIPAWVVSVGIKKRCRQFLEIAKFIRENRLSQSTFLHSHELTPMALRTHCHGCHKKFRVLLTRKDHCQRCGEVFCHACSKLWAVKVDGERHNVRICTGCTIDADNMDKVGTTFVFSTAAPPPPPRRRKSHNSSLVMQKRMSSHTSVPETVLEADVFLGSVRNDLIPFQSTK